MTSKQDRLDAEEMLRGLREWAQQHNDRLLWSHEEMLAAYARERGSDLRSREGRALALMARDEDSRISAKVTGANPDGRPQHGPPDAELRAIVQAHLDAGSNLKKARNEVRHTLYRREMIARVAAHEEGRTKLRPEERCPSMARIIKRTAGLRKRS